MTTLLIFFAIALGASFICSLTEAGFLSIGRVEIARLIEEGAPSGRILEDQKRHGDRSLAAILTLNTVANMVGAAGVGAAAAAIWGNAGVGAASGALTLAILVFGEVVPKSLGAKFSYRLARPIATSVRIMTIVTYPAVVVLQRIARWFGGSTPSPTSRADIAVFAKIGHADGAIERDEAEAIERLLEVERTPLSKIMIPWEQVRKFQLDLTIAELAASGAALEHYAYPVYDPTDGGPVGKLRRSDALARIIRGDTDVTVGELARPVRHLPPDEGLDQLDTERMVIVEDSQGKPLGVATMVDGYQYLLPTSEAA